MLETCGIVNKVLELLFLLLLVWSERFLEIAVPTWWEAVNIFIIASQQDSMMAFQNRQLSHLGTSAALNV